jgi:hypothetical protein
MSDELRQFWRVWHEENDRLWLVWETQRDAWEEENDGCYCYPIRPPHFPFPPELYGLTCGAKTRAGTPCKRTDLYRNGRCKFHGGLSTGPTTAEGKQRAAQNGLRPKKKRTP